MQSKNQILCTEMRPSSSPGNYHPLFLPRRHLWHRSLPLPFYIIIIFYHYLSKNSIIAMTHVTGGSPINRTSRPRQSVSPARQTQTQLSSSQSQDHDLIVGGVTLIRPREEMKKKYYQRALDKAQIIGAIGTLKLCKVK